MLPGGDTFLRYLGLFLYFTEWYFEPVGRIPLHLKLSRKIPSRNVLICRSSVSSLARLSTLSKHIPQFFDLSREQCSVLGHGSSFPLYSRTIKTHPEIQAEPQSRKNVFASAIRCILLGSEPRKEFFTQNSLHVLDSR